MVRAVTQRRMLGVALGATGAGVALLVTWAYLSSIEIDDGLEALIVIPLLLGAGVIVGAVLAVVGGDGVSVLLSALGSVLTFAGFLLGWRVVGGRGGPPIWSQLVFVAWAIFPFALVGTALGWFVVKTVREMVGGRRAVDPSPSS